MPGEVEVAYGGRVWVRGAPCDHCLLSPDKIVSGARAREIVTETRTEAGATFICHKGQVGEDAQNSICRGWWDRFAAEDTMLRWVQAEGLVAFTEVVEP